MKISFNWLKELVPTLPPDATVGEVARRLTLAGLEVESIEERGRALSGVRVAEVRGVRPHPSADKLRIVRLGVGPAGGTEPESEVVCGAPNVPAPGGRVAWAAPGARLPGGLTIGRKDVRGFDSPGMICSEKELGIGEASGGILILPGADIDAGPFAVGAALAAALGLPDDVLEVNVTPNRPDALSHAGIAREVAALFGVGWKFPAAASIAAGGEGGAGARGAPAAAPRAPITVDIQDPAACPRYQATVLLGVKVAESPLPIRLRLGGCGVRAISNLVDVTNYAMLETGHPLHAFDLDKVEGGIVVRRAAADEVLRTLDGVDRALHADDIVIADARGPVALAGVMGGARTEVTDATVNVLLEAATFNPRAVRRTAKRLGLHSEASHRFERGVDANTVPVAGARAAAMMVALAGGRVAGPPVDRYVAPVEPRRVKLTAATLRRIAGFDIPTGTAAAKLRGIDIATAPDADGLVATVPTFRPDITIEEDLVEEVMRLVGYDQAPTRLPAGGKAPAPSPERLADRARDALAAAGLHEIVGWAFVPRARLEALGGVWARGIAVKNPISADYEVMRTSLLPGLAEAARRNLAHGVGDVRLFEVGPCVFPAAGDAHHTHQTYAAGLIAGRRAGWLKPGEPVDFYDSKRVAVELLATLGVRDPRFSALTAAGVSVDGPAGAPTGLPTDLPTDVPTGLPTDVPTDVPTFLHPGVSAAIARAIAPGGPPAPRIGLVGELHPSVARRLGLDVPAFYFEVHLDPLENQARAVRAVSVPRFPAVTRDVSFWIDAAVSADGQATAMRASADGLLRDIAVLEDFRDARFVPPGKKGMLWTLTYRADDRTLTDAEVDAAHARVVASLSAAHAIQIR